MEIRIYIQDPTHAETTYLYEAILEAATDVAMWRGIYAFASRDGVDHLIGDQVIQEFMRKGGEIDLLVGLDAVTNRSTLERLQELEQQNEHFRPKVFWNETVGLFHPKLSDFRYTNGSRKLIIGSGNLTPGGLAANYEGYAVITAESGEEIEFSAIDDFVGRHASEIRRIDDDALERGAKNLVKTIKRVRQIGNADIAQPPRFGGVPTAGQIAPDAGLGRVLVAEVPKAGDRWAQVHFNMDVVREYFCISDNKTQRVYLTQITSNGEQENVEIRQCVYSETNKNHKIEIGAAAGIKYPEIPPVLVLLERQLRVFNYMLLMPGDDGYESLIELAEKLPKTGRGHTRVITSVSKLKEAWAGCPLLAPRDAGGQEI